MLYTTIHYNKIVEIITFRTINKGNLIRQKNKELSLIFRIMKNAFINFQQTWKKIRKRALYLIEIEKRNSII